MDAVVVMPSELRRVHVRTIENDGAVRLTVSDTGPDIPAERLAQMSLSNARAARS